MPDNNFHKEVLTKEQIELLPVIAEFSDRFGLVGGTAVALHIGHRESIDFDLFSLTRFSNMVIRNKVSKRAKIDNIIVNKLGEFTFLIKEVKFTFFHYPFGIKFNKSFGYSLKMPDLITLAAMKAYALGMRAKWKDYIDLYFIMKDFHSIEEISKKANEIFKGEFNERMFRNQLCYFEDINYSEPVVYKKGFETKEEVVKRELIEFGLS